METNNSRKRVKQNSRFTFSNSFMKNTPTANVSLWVVTSDPITALPCPKFVDTRFVHHPSAACLVRTNQDQPTALVVGRVVGLVPTQEWKQHHLRDRTDDSIFIAGVGGCIVGSVSTASKNEGNFRVFVNINLNTTSKVAFVSKLTLFNYFKEKYSARVKTSGC